MNMGVSRCNGCGETVKDIDAGFSPGVHGMAHTCGGRWRVLQEEEITEKRDPRAEWRDDTVVVVDSAGGVW